MEITTVDAEDAGVDDDGETFRDVAGRAIRASYSLSPEQIEAVVHEEFGDERLRQRSRSDDEVVVVAEDEDEVTGFATGAVVDDEFAEIDWLFVAPEARGRDIGTELFEAVRDELEARGAETVHAAVLSENEEGEQFFEQFGYERVGTRDEAIGEQDFGTYVYGPEGGSAAKRELHEPDTIKTEDGETLYTGDEELQGKEAPFLVLYSDEHRTEQYGFFCTNDGTMANAADGLERIDCNTCGNESRADEWDGSYL
jgi:ribosomal protein S18 acetylase RimI-like enzyme